MRMNKKKSMNAIREDGNKVIVMTHFPPFNFKCEDSEMTKLFEEYQVDLVIGGHEHVFLRKDALYNNEKRTRKVYTKNAKLS